MKKKVRQFLNLAKEIGHECVCDKITCEECELQYGDLCSLHSDLLEELEMKEVDEVQTTFEDLLVEVLGAVTVKMDNIKRAYGENVDVKTIEDVIGGKGQKEYIKRDTYIFLLMNIPVAIFGIEYDFNNKAVEVGELVDLGGLM